MRSLFEQFGNGSSLYGGDKFVIWLNIAGLALIALTFMAIGILCVFLADTPQDPPKTRKGILFTKLFGYFLICCALSRLVDMVSFWYNYPIFNGWLRILTGSLAGIAIFMIPSIVKETKEQMMYKDASKKLDHTNKKLEEVQELSKKLDIQNDTTTS